MPFRNENVLRGLKEKADYQVGDTDPDAVGFAESKVLLPWPSDPLASWVYYDCTVEVMLDSGIAVHCVLPQVNRLPDTLASCLIDDPKLDRIAAGGVNLKSVDQYADIVQRMGHSRYWFRLYGQALRVGLKVPIPALKTIGGVPAVPYDRNPQLAFNRIAPGGNYGGVILWHAAWSLWYTCAVPPRNDTIPAVDAAAHIADNGKAVKDLDGIQAPYSRPDDSAVPGGNLTFLGK